MIQTYTTAAVLIASSALAGCAHQVRVVGEPQVSEQAVLRIDTVGVEAQEDSFDVELDITNTSEGDIIISLGDVECSRGGVKGRVAHAAFGIGERTIDIAPGARKDFTLLCMLDDGPTSGQLVMLIRRVFDNPSGDGKTRGEAIARDVLWRIAAE